MSQNIFKLNLFIQKQFFKFFIKSIKKHYVFTIVLIYSSLNAQVGVNTVTPGDGSMLDIESTDKGILVPRVNIADLNTIAPVTFTTAAEESLLVYNTNTTTGKGFYYWDTSKWVPLLDTEDGDFHQVGTSTVPTAITQDVFRTGKVAIGKTVASSALDISDNTSANAVNVETTGSDNILNLQRSGSKSGTARGLYVDYVNSDPGSGSQQGIATFVRGGAGTGSRYGVYNDVRSYSGGSQNIFGTYNLLTNNNGTGAHTGSFNRLAGNTNRTKRGVNNYITGSDDGEHVGVNNNISSNTGAGDHTGVVNSIGGTGLIRGVYNNYSDSAGPNTNRGVHNSITNNGNGLHQGVYTSISGSGTGEHMGVSNFISGTGTGEHRGTANTMTGTGTGTKYGTFNTITQSTGDNYGTFNDINNTETGKVSYGTFNDINTDNGTNYAGWFDSYGTGGVHYAAVFNRGDVVANEYGGDNDFRIEGQSDQNLFFADASTDRIGIGNNSPNYTLDVTGTLRVTGDIRKTGVYNFPDHVFEQHFDGFNKYGIDYNMKNLVEVENFIKKNKHLPGVQTREDVLKNGWNLTEGVRVNLEKIEELFIHSIEASKKERALKDKNVELSKKLEKALSAIEILQEKVAKLENKAK